MRTNFTSFLKREKKLLTNRHKLHLKPDDLNQPGQIVVVFFITKHKTLRDEIKLLEFKVFGRTKCEVKLIIYV